MPLPVHIQNRKVITVVSLYVDFNSRRGIGLVPIRVPLELRSKLYT